jgi:hypothetical protein
MMRATSLQRVLGVAIAVASFVSGVRAEAAQGDGRTPVFALVVGVNEPLDPGPPKLLYADDDAILFHRIFAPVGRSILLVAPDAATARLHSVPEARRPTRANLKAAADEILSLVARARDRGERPQLYFVYSGHGDVKNNEGYLALADHRLTARDLSELLLARSRAVANHVIVDACKSYFIVRERRAGGERAPAAGFHRSQSLLERFPSTGFLLSTSSAASSHECEEFQAGIFSHEVRSGLLGAADVNRDGRISYNEMRAFIEVANSAIRNERYRPSIFVRPPRDDGRVALIAARGGRAPALTVPPARAGRYFLEDANGVRLADMHTAATGAVTIVVPRDTHLYMHDLGRHMEYLVDPRPGQRQIVALPVRPATHRVKGAGHEAFMKIFSVPFGALAYRQLLAQYAHDDPKLQGTRCVRCVCEPCDGEPPPEPAPEPAPPVPAPPPAVRVSLRPAHQRFPWQHLIEARLGFALTTRSFAFSDHFDPKPAPSFQALLPMIALELGLYPLSTRPGPLAGLGLALGVQRSVGVESKLSVAGASEALPTALQDIAGDLRFRIGLGDGGAGPLVLLVPRVGGGAQSFAISWPGSASLQQVLPNISYRYLRAGLDAELALLRRGSVYLGLPVLLDYLHVFSAGDIESRDATGYGAASVGGITFGAALQARVSGFVARLGYRYRRMFFSFDNDCYKNKEGCRAAAGALDLYHSFEMLFGYAY